MDNLKLDSEDDGVSVWKAGLNETTASTAGEPPINQFLSTTKTEDFSSHSPYDPRLDLYALDYESAISESSSRAELEFNNPRRVDQSKLRDRIIHSH